MNYREKAEKCIEFTALPEMRRQFEECGCSLDAQYAKYGDTPYFHGEVVEPGHVYIVGYPCCVCPEAANSEISDPNFCECSRQSVLYVLENLLPGRKIEVKTLHTALFGGENCSFLVTVE